MELPEVGSRCSHPDCKQLDFLPLICPNCDSKFCTEHFNLHTRSCIIVEKEVSLKIFEGHKCAKCGVSNVVPIICEKCGENFCVEHRHFDDCGVDPEAAAQFKAKQAIPEQQFNEAKEEIDKQVAAKIDQAKKRGSKTASKVQLMKIKNNATGNKKIPTSDRIYFNVVHQDKTVPVFVSKTWSVGRAIDAVALELKLKNDNNKKGEKKLRLFKKECGRIISENLAESLENLSKSGAIEDGENLVIEYVSEQCQQILEI